MTSQILITLDREHLTENLERFTELTEKSENGCYKADIKEIEGAFKLEPRILDEGVRLKFKLSSNSFEDNYLEENLRDLSSEVGRALGKLGFIPKIDEDESGSKPNVDMIDVIEGREALPYLQTLIGQLTLRRSQCMQNAGSGFVVVHPRGVRAEHPSRRKVQFASPPRG